jgi:hypothetical protein
MLIARAIRMVRKSWIPTKTLNPSAQLVPSVSRAFPSSWDIPETRDRSIRYIAGKANHIDRRHQEETIPAPHIFAERTEMRDTGVQRRVSRVLSPFSLAIAEANHLRGKMTRMKTTMNEHALVHGKAREHSCAPLSGFFPLQRWSHRR